MSTKRKHYLKTLSPFYERVISGQKKFEVRKDDRDYQVGDYLFLQNFDGKDFTGDEAVYTISYKLPGGIFGIKKGFCVLGIEEHFEKQ